MFLSVIIPVYNAQDYLSRCLNSVFEQNFTDFEVIVIDDGSTDNSLNLLNSYKTNLPQLKVITSANNGVSSARNTGLSLAGGDYVVFLDSDDWVEQGYFSFLWEELSTSHIDGIVLGYIEDYGNKTNRISPNSSNFSLEISSSEYINKFFKGEIKANPWDKVFKRSIFTVNSILFPTNITIGEDAIVSLQLGSVSTNIKVRNNAFIHYMQNTGGVTKVEVSSKKFNDVNNAMNIIFNTYKDSYPYNTLCLYVFKNLLHYVFAIKYANKAEYKSKTAFFYSIIKKIKIREVSSLKWIGIIMLFKYSRAEKSLRIYSFISQGYFKYRKSII